MGIAVIDSHGHLDDRAFAEDKYEIVSAFKSNGIAAFINVSANRDSNFFGAELSEKYDNVFFSAGIHPIECGELDFGFLDTVKELYGRKKCVAIGEIGLDYHWDVNPRQIQKEWFVKQIKLAHEAELPICIHSRDAAQDTLDIVKAEDAGRFGGVVHCYSYGIELAKEYMKLGFHFGIGGVVTYKNAKTVKEVVDYLPIDRIVLETDCPYLAPVPHRGERNDSRNLTYVAAEIGAIKGCSPEDVIKITADNARKVYARLS